MKSANLPFSYFSVHKIKALHPLEEFSASNLAMYAVRTLFSHPIGS